MSNSFYHERYSLTKRQEEVIKALLPAPKATPSLDSLKVFNAIVFENILETIVADTEKYLLVTRACW